MRVILIQDIDRLGKAGEVKDVADGYGRNYLLPKKLAELESTEGLKRADEYRRAEERRQQALNAEMEGLAGALDGMEINIKAKAGDKDRLYGSVTSTDIAEEAKRVTGHDIDKRKIALDEPIHHLGEYEITVKLSRDLAPTLKVIVAAEEVEGGVEDKPEAESEAKAEKKSRKKAEAEPEEAPDAEPEEATRLEEEEVLEAGIEEETEASIGGESESEAEESAEDISKESSE